MCMFSRVFISNKRDLTTCSVQAKINKSIDSTESHEIYIEMKVEFYPSRYVNVPFKYLDALHRFWTIQKKIEWNSTFIHKCDLFWMILLSFFCLPRYYIHLAYSIHSVIKCLYILLWAIMREFRHSRNKQSSSMHPYTTYIHLLRTLITKIIWKCRSFWEARRLSLITTNLFFLFSP